MSAPKPPKGGLGVGPHNVIKSAFIFPALGQLFISQSYLD